ncbi:transglycosylase SLT domain protein [Bacteriovorax sp. BAL6_X]|uniref:lytic transglycosylase domain-containing protein n=1 Tax=Bacteriovorax sp. BAL6_X TaxID=1201290 RepID=UPI00038548FA|nr:lytic transglycosylase domain-containing protein [Bacteriovorax sp. BAL6_X]EPZ52385.1 transglycosylase SLT domain protein [Bacteriovorax sp. BAL6_X]
MRINGLILLVASQLLFSCISVEKDVPSPKDISEIVETDTEIEADAEFSEEKIIARSAKHGAEFSSDQIVGSAKIEHPTSHELKTYFLYGAEHLNLENNYFDIPVVYNAAVKKWIKYFTTRGRGFFERYSARAGRYAPILSKVLKDNGLPQDLIFLAMAESGFQTKAKSWAKAVGPWQFMPYTGRRYGLEVNWYVDERRDPIKSSYAASKYLRKLFNQFGSWELAAASYNAGEGKMSRAIRRYRTKNFWKIRKGRYLKPETKNYVPKIMALAIIGKNLKSFGFEEIDWHEPLDFQEISVPGGADLFEIAKDLNVEFDDLHYLNPEIQRWFTPPTHKTYTLRVPVGKREQWAACCTQKNYVASQDVFQKYRVRGKRTRLDDVARKFKIKDKEVLTWLNDDYRSHRSRVKRGSYVTLPFRIGQSKKDNMYADLYDKPRKSVVRKRKYRNRIRLAKQRGKKISNPTKYYTVQRGDSLWSVSRKTGVSLDTLIVSNLNIIKKRQIRAGDRLVIK